MKYLVLATTILLAACSAGYQSSFCYLASPVYLSEKTVEVMTQEEKAILITHNETGEALCGWKPAND